MLGIIKDGKVIQLIFVIIIVVLTYVSYTLGKGGKTWEIKTLEALEAMYEGIGRAAEMGKPVLTIPGIGNLSNAQTIAGLSVVGEVGRRSAEIGVTPLVTASNTQVITVAEAITRGAFNAAGKPDLYETGAFVRWYGQDQFSYAVGASGLILAEKPAMVIQLGYFIVDVAVVAETASRVGALQIGGSLMGMELIAMFSDFILIGEDMFAASAAITKDPIAVSTLAGQDWIRMCVIATLLLGILSSFAGSNFVYNLLGM